MNPLDEVVARYEAQLSRDEAVRALALSLAVQSVPRDESVALIRRRAESFREYIEGAS